MTDTLTPEPLLPTDAANTLSLLNAWTDLGWLRRLDSAMAAFVHDLDPLAPPAVLVASALLTHMEGRGHSCLPLAPLVSQPKDLLAWPGDSHAALDRCWAALPVRHPDWTAALLASPLVRQAFAQPSAAHPQAQADCGQPLVLGGSAEAPLMFLRRYWHDEQTVASSILARTRALRAVDSAAARGWLDKLFPARSAPAAPDQLVPDAAPDWQKIACALALRAGLTVITGGPGTGKTYTAARLLALQLAMHGSASPLKVALAAPTGKAAARLRQSIDDSLKSLQVSLGEDLDLDALTRRIGPAKTVHALLGARPGTRQFKHNAAHPLDLDLLIVDETSMVHLEMMAALLAALPATARLILLGDKDQLASVEAGAVLGDLCVGAEDEGYPQSTLDYVQATTGIGLGLSQAPARSTALAQQTVMLRHSRRFGSVIGQLALAVNSCPADAPLRWPALPDAASAQDRHSVWRLQPPQARPDSVLKLAVQGRAQASVSYANYLGLINARPPAVLADEVAHRAWAISVLKAFEQFRILCAVHDGPWGDRELNRQVQKALADTGALKPSGLWFVGRPIMVTRNDAALGVFNGDVGVVLPAPGAGRALRAYFLDGETLRSVAVSRLAHVETAFAMTVHKSQGSEFEHTVLVLPQGQSEGATKELVYTGITRAKTWLSIVEGEPDALAAAARRRLRRVSGLRLLLGG
jgi:exodeoxyribonuclease V alpha subunit